MAIQARVDAVRTALELGANVNAVDKEGMTALMHASIHGRIEIMTLLLERGAKKDLTDAVPTRGHTVSSISAFSIRRLSEIVISWTCRTSSPRSTMPHSRISASPRYC